MTCFAVISLETNYIQPSNCLRYVYRIVLYFMVVVFYSQVLGDKVAKFWTHVQNTSCTIKTVSFRLLLRLRKINASEMSDILCIFQTISASWTSTAFLVDFFNEIRIKFGRIKSMSMLSILELLKDRTSNSGIDYRKTNRYKLFLIKYVNTSCSPLFTQSFCKFC